MSIKAQPVTSELAIIKFDVLGNSYAKTPTEAKAFTEALLATTHATTLKFTEVVSLRGIVLQNTTLDATRVKLAEPPASVVEQKNPKMRHAQQVCHLKGPFSAQEFIQMMQIKENISIEAWEAHMDRFSAIQLQRSKL
jgi:hypothetical protein